jgi:hypothetical protein
MGQPVHIFRGMVIADEICSAAFLGWAYYHNSYLKSTIYREDISGAERTCILSQKDRRDITADASELRVLFPEPGELI